MEYIKKQVGKFWGYAYLRPRSEKAVAEFLAANGVTFYLPLVPRARLHHGTKVVTDVPMISGYVFLAVGDFERSELKRAERHIIQIELLREPSNEDAFIFELNILRTFELLGQKERVLINPGIRSGDRVIITRGPLKGLETFVVRREDGTDSIVVNLNILNRSIEYPVSADILKKISD